MSTDGAQKVIVAENGDMEITAAITLGDTAEAIWHPLIKAGHHAAGPGNKGVKAFDVTRRDLQEMADNINGKVMGEKGVPISEGPDHSPGKQGASGWIREAKVEGDTLLGYIKPT